MMYGIDCESQEEEETFWPLCQNPAEGRGGRGESRCVEFFFSLNMDGLENSGEGEGSRGHANIGQASLNFDCAHPRERGWGQEKKFRFMNEIRQKNRRPLAQNDPPSIPKLRSRTTPIRYFWEEDDLRRPSAAADIWHLCHPSLAQ